MKIEYYATPFVAPQSAAAEGAKKSTASGKPVQQDQWTVSNDYQQYAAASTPKKSVSQAKIDVLTEQLRNDSSFIKKGFRDFGRHPVAQELATEIILSDEGLQERIAKSVWRTLSGLAGDVYLPPSWRDIDVRSMLASSDELTRQQVFTHYEGVLRDKAVTVGLNDTEKLLCSRAEEVSNHTSSTFDQQMNRIFEKVKAEFEANGMTFDESKSYDFHFDTDVYQFSVTGGSSKENALIEKVLNTSHYTGDNFLETLNAIYNHRQEDGAYLPWIAEGLRCQSGVPIFGVVSVSLEYAKKMEQLVPAYTRCRMDRELKAEYGFGVEDLSYQNGKICGMTPAAQAVIDNDEGDFMKRTGYAYINMCKRYKGTPKFTEPIFIYRDGKFQTTYQTFDKPCKEGTDSSAIIARAHQRLDQEAAALEAGRDRVLATRRSGLYAGIDALAQKLVQDETFATNGNMRFWEHPIGRELAKRLVLSDGSLLSRVAEMMQNNFTKSMAGDGGLLLPMNNWEFDIRSILSGDDEVAIDQVLKNYDFVLNQRACTVGLSKVEQYLKGARN